MKQILVVMLLLAGNQFACAQFTIHGSVRDKKTLQMLPGAFVVIDKNLSNAVTDSSGNFKLSNIAVGKHQVAVSYLGYQVVMKEFDIASDITYNFEMEQLFFMTTPVEIIATRANEKSAMAYSTITKDEIEKINSGRDIPYLLETVPSLVTTSDGGNGVGYTGLRLRGSDGTRVNVTVDGIPVNDSESQILYWVDMPDLASSIDNIQVQRGVGSSTNGASAFGGSINIQTNKPSAKPFLNTSASYGSFNTLKSNATIGSGMIDGKWNFEGRLSKIKSDGYIDRATSDLKSFYIAGGFYGKKDIIKLKIFSGKEITYQSWYGVPEASLDTNRTWNYYNYENQVDDYQQDNYQLFYTHAFSDKLKLNTALHYTYGRGFYEEFKEGEMLSDYNLLPVISGSDTILSTDLVRRKWLRNDFYGTVISVVYEKSDKLSLIFGGAWNQYNGDHFGEITWAQFASNSFIRDKYYDNNGLKTDYNIYGKLTAKLISKLSAFADLQYRNINYEFTGFDDTGSVLGQSVNLNFFNPKAGLTYTVKPGQYGYISFSVANKEPSRDDYTETSKTSRPQPERLYDIESGYRQQKEKYSFGFNYYLMQYDNQLVLTGEINDVGNYTRTNIKNSFREGIELEGSRSIFKKFALAGNLTLSRNKIKQFREYTDDYDNGGQILQVYTNTEIAFSPKITGFISAGWKPLKSFEIQLANRYVGEQYLDNTSRSTSALDAYFVSDLRIYYSIKPKFMKAIELSFMINNIFDETYESNGYAYSYFYGGEKTTENFYYPQAGRNFMGMVTMKF